MLSKIWIDVRLETLFLKQILSEILRVFLFKILAMQIYFIQSFD